jgi:transposase
MENIGIDVHKRESQICILSAEGELIEQRIHTDRERFTEVLGKRPRARILIEASTESEWVARCLEGLGHEVVVADPNFASMYATRSRRVKTDRRDARTLAEACQLGAYRRAHRTSDERRHMKAQLAVREVMVRTRAKYISLIQALLGREGWRVGTGSSARFGARVDKLELREGLKAEVAPLLELMTHLNEQIERADTAMEEVSHTDAQMDRLLTMPSIGPVTAAAFVATIDDAKRFGGAHQVQAYLGLVPSEMSSGEKQRRGRITKVGNARVRWLLVQAAISTIRLRKPQTQVLRLWAERIAVRRGKRRAAVALARRIAGILYAMMRDGTRYVPKIAAPEAAQATA